MGSSRRGRVGEVAQRDLTPRAEGLGCGPTSGTHIRRVLTARHNLPEEARKLMKIRPLSDRLVVKRTVEEEKTKGGIIIPDTAKEKPLEGVVVAVGSGSILKNGKVVPMDVKAGDKVLFGKYTGTEVKVDGEDLVLLREDDVLAVFTK